VSVDYDVVVVGARCAGAATAMLLARGGLRVLAVDRARYGSDTLSTHALTRPGVLQLSRWGVLDEVRAAGTPVVNRVIYHYLDEVADLPVRPRGDVDGLYAPRRYLLDQILVDAAARAGAEVRHRTGVRELYLADGRVAGVVLDGPGGRGPVVRAGLVVGADGARSTVARLVGAELRYAAPHSTATVYTFVDGLPADAYRNWFGAGVGAALIPTNGGQANVSVGVPMARLRRRRTDPARWFAARLAEAAPELAAAVAGYAGRRYPTFVGLPGCARRSWGPGWALVGDAAYFKDPISAHGMTDALIGAELLARAVLADGPGSLAGYERERERLAAPMIPAVAHVASFGGDPASLRQAHRAMNAAMRAEWDYLTGLPSQVGAARLG
jgi:flavin-dependent dehydrogenase